MLTTIPLTAPVAPWLGGKRNLAKRICATIDAFHQEKVRTTYTISATRNDPAGGRAELLIRN